MKTDLTDEAVFTELAKEIAEEHGLELLEVVNIPRDDFNKVESYLNADFFWNGRLIKLRLENDKLSVFGVGADIANPNSIKIVKERIEELKNDPRMLPKWVIFDSGIKNFRIGFGQNQKI